MDKKLAQLVEDTVNFSRDSVREKQLVAGLKKLDHIESVGVLKDLVARRSPCAISVATRVLNDHDSAFQLFSFAFPIADAQGIKAVLEFGLTKLGARNLFRALADVKPAHPQQIEKALYFLPNLLRAEDADLLDELKE